MIPKQLEFAKEHHTQVKTRVFVDPFQMELAEFWLENYGTISTILQQTEAQAKRMQETDLEFVPCHPNIHTGNVLLSDDGKIFIVDWDETLLAPKERDLLFVKGSIFNDRSEGGRAIILRRIWRDQIDPLALAYYRYDWCVEDMGEFAKEISDRENTGEETKTNSIWWFKNLFSLGKSVETALATQIET